MLVPTKYSKVESFFLQKVKQKSAKTILDWTIIWFMRSTTRRSNNKAYFPWNSVAKEEVDWKRWKRQTMRPKPIPNYYFLSWDSLVDPLFLLLSFFSMFVGTRPFPKMGCRGCHSPRRNSVGKSPNSPLHIRLISNISCTIRLCNTSHDHNISFIMIGQCVLPAHQKPCLHYTNEHEANPGSTHFNLTLQQRWIHPGLVALNISPVYITQTNPGRTLFRLYCETI